MKKTLAILLSLALVLCMMPGAAFAETTPAPTISSIAIEAIADQTFTGSQIKPAVTVTATMSDATTKALATTEYTVEYGTNTAAASPGGTVTVKLVADETKTASANFNILPYDIAANGITASVDNKTTVEAAKAITVADIHFYKGGVEVNYDYLNSTNIKVTPTSADNANFTATIEGQANLTGTITANFKVVADIASAKVATNTAGVTAANPDGANATLNAGIYNGGTKTINSLFYLVGSDSKAINTGNYTVTATDSASKTVTAVKDAGTYNIKVKGMNAYGGEKDITLTIGQKDASLAAGLVRVDAITGQYSSDQFSSIVPTVRDAALGVLTAGKDYSYRVDSGLVTITFMGNYTGTQTVPFTVVADANDIAKIYSTLGIKIDGKDLASYVKNPSLYYNGASQAPYITVAKLSSSYYTIEYRYTDAAGKAQVVSYPKDAANYEIYMVGKNGYGGEKKLGEMTIQPFKTDWVEVTASAGYTTSTPYVYVRSLDGTITFVQDKDYKITNTYVSSATNKVKVYISTMGNIESDLLTAEYSIIGKNIAYCTVEFATGSKQYNNYTGTAIKPTVKVRDGYTLLSAGSDYTVTYKDAAGKVVAAPKDAGTYIIEITGKGAYSGTTTMYYYINGTDISSYTVTLKADSAKADGTAKTPVISSVKYGYYSTLSSADYTVTYEDPQGNTVNAYSIKAPGTYKVIVTGKGGYSGSTYAYFTVVGTPQEIYIPKTSYKVYKDSDSFTIKATATGDGTGFSYVSSDPTVASVSSTGKVTIHKLGRAKITVTTTGMKKSDPASDDVYVKVYPDKGTLSQKPWTEGKKGSLRVRWDKQDDVTYYEVRYSRDKSFKSGSYKTKKVTASTLSYDTQSTRLTGLKSGSKYYVKVRAVKEVKNDYGQTLKYYGTWSNWRSATTK